MAPYCQFIEISLKQNIIIFLVYTNKYLYSRMVKDTLVPDIYYNNQKKMFAERNNTKADDRIEG